MNRTLLAFMLALCSISSAQVQYPYNPDGNFDGQIGASDILDILVLYGNDFALGTFQSDSNSAILYVGEMTFWNCKSNCTGLTGNWKVLDDYLVGTYSETLVDLEPIWLSSSITRSEDLQNAALLEWPDWSGGEIIASLVDRFNVNACVCQTRVNPLLEDIDPCAGLEDECGVCQGEGAIYECGCSDIPEGDCDCDGNQLDALGVCGGDCPLDVDGDGVCDPVCGNGIVEGDETCDDGNDNPNDGCDGCQQIWACGDSLEYWSYAYQTIEAADGRCWFAENLMSPNYNDGTPINYADIWQHWDSEGSNSPDYTNWYCCLQGEGVYTDFSNSDSNGDWTSTGNYGCPYGDNVQAYMDQTRPYYLYDFISVNTGLLCPSGWHVPTATEWDELFQSYGGGKEATIALLPSDIASNSHNCQFEDSPIPLLSWGSSGLNLHVGGEIDGCRGFWHVCENGNCPYWSSTVPDQSLDGSYAQTASVGAPCGNVSNPNTTGKAFRDGHAVRCIKDQ